MARKPRKPKKPTIPAPSGLDPLAAWSMPQIQSWAQRQARATIDPILADIDRQQANNTANITGFSEALARTLAPLGRQVQGAYTTAAGMGDAFGSGFQEGLRMLGGQATTEGGGQVAGSLAGLAGNLSTIAGRGIGQEGAAQTTLADTYALAPANTGQQYLREAQGRFDAQRREVRGKVPETVQAIIQDLLDREIQKDAQRANRETLKLQQEQLTEDQRQFDQTLQLDRERFQSDASYRNATLRAEEDARTDRLRGERRDAARRRNEAIDSVTADLTESVAAELAPQFADKQVGTQPRVAGIKPKYKTVPEFPNRPNGPQKQVRDGYETWYYRADGSLTTDPAEAATEPVYEKQPVSSPEYKAIRARVLGMLKNSLRRYGLKDSRYQLLADQVLAPYFDVDYENLSTTGPYAADRGFDYSASALDTGYP